MATTKRERQRANRELRQAQDKKTKTRQQLKTRVILWSKIGLIVVVLLFISNALFGGNDDAPAGTTTTTLVETTLAP